MSMAEKQSGQARVSNRRLGLRFGYPVAALVVAIAAAAVPVAAQQTIALNVSVGPEANGAAVVGFHVRVRNASTDQLADSTAATQAGQFSFDRLQPAVYVVELVDSTGQVAGMSSSLSVTNGSALVVTVGGGAAGALTTGGAAAGRDDFGPLASVTVSGASSATVSVKPTREGRLVVCHKVSEVVSQTLGIRDAVRGEHLGHGDLLGACPKGAR